MKKILVMMAVVMALPTFAVAGDGPWFDMVNCQMCKHMAAEPGFMENVGWENHVLENGWMMVTVVEEDFKDKFAAVHSNMEAEGAKIMGGAEAHLCNFCTSYMDVMKSGKVQTQDFETIGGKIALMTSSDPAVAMQLKKIAKTTIHEMKKMEAAHTESK